MSSRAKKRLKAARKQAAANLGQSYISRNDPCPCGSGKKAKHCCLNKIKMLKALPPAVREQLMVARILGQGQPGPVPAAVAEQFAAIQAQARVPEAAAPVDATALPVDAPIDAAPEGILDDPGPAGEPGPVGIPDAAPVADPDDTAAVVAQQMAADPVAATAGDGPAAEFPVPGVTLPIESATIQMDGCAPVQLTGGTITINPPETTEAQTP